MTKVLLFGYDYIYMCEPKIRSHQLHPDGVSSWKKKLIESSLIHKPYYSLCRLTHRSRPPHMRPLISFSGSSWFSFAVESICFCHFPLLMNIQTDHLYMQFVFCRRLQHLQVLTFLMMPSYRKLLAPGPQLAPSPLPHHHTSLHVTLLGWIILLFLTGIICLHASRWCRRIQHGITCLILAYLNCLVLLMLILIIV
jgi:hypothetical protein